MIPKLRNISDTTRVIASTLDGYNDKINYIDNIFNNTRSFSDDLRNIEKNFNGKISTSQKSFSTIGSSIISQITSNQNSTTSAIGKILDDSKKSLEQATTIQSSLTALSRRVGEIDENVKQGQSSNQNSFSALSKKIVDENNILDTKISTVQNNLTALIRRDDTSKNNDTESKSKQQVKNDTIKTKP